MTQNLRRPIGRPTVFLLFACVALSLSAYAQTGPPATGVATQLLKMDQELGAYKNGQWDGHLAKARKNIRRCADILNGKNGVPIVAALTDAEGVAEPANEEQDPVLLSHSQALSKILSDGGPTVRSKCTGYLQNSIEEVKDADAYYASKHGGAISPPRGQAVPTSARQQYPSVPYNQFLLNMPDEALRQKLWTFFFLAERAAHSIVTSPARWVTLNRVEYVARQKNPASWSPNGVIHMRAGAAPSDYPGAMFHEIFHTAYQNSVFRDSHGDKMWNEAFANAFRYAAEREFLATPSKWIGKTDAAGRKTFEQLIANGDSSRKRIYVYPCTLIIKKSGGTMTGFRDLWRQLSRLHEQRGGDVLDQFFGYSPRKAAGG